MGKFLYGRDTSATFEDRLLLHLQLVMGMKLRRGESFTFSWKHDPTLGDGRTTVWIHPRSTIVFMYSGSRPSQVNRPGKVCLPRHALPILTLCKPIPNHTRALTTFL